MSKAYYESHKAELAAKGRARYRADPKRHLAKAKEWRARNKDRMRAYMAKWRAEHREELKAYARTHSAKYASRRAEYSKRYQLKYRYNLTPDELRDMEVGQAARCLICHRVPLRPLVVDHDHATGQIRGLLCSPCNRMLGSAHDDVRVLQAAIRYLEGVSCA